MANTEIFDHIITVIRDLTGVKEEPIPLHEPRFIGNERQYVVDAINSTYVSSMGNYIKKFEKMIAELTGADFAIAVVNGTSALHTALLLAGVEKGDEVITQPLSFVATANAISYTGARPVFVDVDTDTLGLSPEKLASFLKTTLKYSDGAWRNKKTGNKIAVCVPMHTFGLPARIEQIVDVCSEYDIPVIEDAAEALGSTYRGNHTGTFGKFGIFSFNGNKTVTSGGGGAIITNDAQTAAEAKHLTTTAKKDHRWEYVHDEIGYNYRMPNLNAALGCAQLEMLGQFIENKRALAQSYASFFEDTEISFIHEPAHSRSNYWLNAIQLKNREERDQFLAYSNERNIMTRPIWRLLNKLPMFKNCMTGNLENAEWLENRIVNIPSSVRVDA